PTQTLTADLTVNTDFAQVEADEQQVNLTRFSLFFPEKRDFFLENQTMFNFGGATSNSTNGDTPVLFYSRRIGLNRGRAIPIRAGGRLTGRMGCYSIGIVNIETGSETVTSSRPTNFSVFRLRRDIWRRSNIGILATNRSISEVGSGQSSMVGLDGT